MKNNYFQGIKLDSIYTTYRLKGIIYKYELIFPIKAPTIHLMRTTSTHDLGWHIYQVYFADYGIHILYLHNDFKYYNFKLR